MEEKKELWMVQTKRRIFPVSPCGWESAPSAERV